MSGSPRTFSSAGFSLVELMIALVLGLLVAEGVFILFSETNRISATEAGRSRLQESGRIALGAIADDIRSAGRQYCGSRVAPTVWAPALSNHIVGAPEIADAPIGWSPARPYELARGVFVEGAHCTSLGCEPKIDRRNVAPKQGLADGERVPGTDVLILRQLAGTGWSVDASDMAQSCTVDKGLGSFVIHKLPGDQLESSFNPAHAAWLSNCSSANIFETIVDGARIRPRPSARGVPTCFPFDSTTRLFDLDSQLETAVYYLVVRKKEGSRDRSAVLMRRVNGVANELTEGVERLDFRFSVTDAAAQSYWLTAAELARSKTTRGDALICALGEATGPCSWSNVTAVEISMLVNSTDDMPANPAPDAWDYRYSIDGSATQRPASRMPITGLPPGRMLRREFRGVVALRSLGT